MNSVEIGDGLKPESPEILYAHPLRGECERIFHHHISENERFIQVIKPQGLFHSRLLGLKQGYLSRGFFIRCSQIYLESYSYDIEYCYALLIDVYTASEDVVKFTVDLNDSITSIGQGWGKHGSEREDAALFTR